MKYKILFAVYFFVSISFAQNISPINESGLKLKEFYLSQNVENLWIGGHHINWETGVADQPDATKNIKTHCSSFVASVCKQKGIYILRPPRHPQGLLASAQYEWLLTNEAKNEGWKQIKDSIYEKAQSFANKGYVVTVVYKNPDPKKPGHIGLVMPFEKSNALLQNEGPTLIQAGRINKNYISFRDGFQHHIRDWKTVTSEILFFYNTNIHF